MIYLYTLLILAWDLDKDTHEYFREFLDIFINHRKISKDLTNFKDKAWPRGEPTEPLSHHLHPLRNGLPNLIYRRETNDDQTPHLWGRRDGKCYSQLRTCSSLSCTTLISTLHQSKYYIAGIQGFSRLTRDNHESLKFEVNVSSIESYCNKIGIKVPHITNKKYFPNIYHDINFKIAILNGTISEEDARATLLTKEIIHCLFQLEKDAIPCIS